MIDFYIQKHGRRLYGLCLSLCRNREDADDLYQETWLKVLKNFQKYDTSQPFENWLSAVCVNTYRDFLRKKKRSTQNFDFVSSEEKDRFLESVPQKVQEDYSVLRLAIENLPEKLRLTVTLFYFHGLNEKMAADALKIPVGTVKSRLNKARKLIKEAMENE